MVLCHASSWLASGPFENLSFLCFLLFLSASFRPLARQYFSKPPCEVLQPLWRVASPLFRHCPTRITYLVQGFHHRRPVVIPFQERHVEPFPKPFLIASLAAEFLNVQLLNPFSKNAHPLFWPPV